MFEFRRFVVGRRSPGTSSMFAANSRRESDVAAQSSASYSSWSSSPPPPPLTRRNEKQTGSLTTRLDDQFYDFSGVITIKIDKHSKRKSIHWARRPLWMGATRRLLATFASLLRAAKVQNFRLSFRLISFDPFGGHQKAALFRFASKLID